jgi:hypothetical protein
VKGEKKTPNTATTPLTDGQAVPLWAPLSPNCKEQKGYLTGTHNRHKLVVFSVANKERLRYALNRGMKSKVIEKIQDRLTTKLQGRSYIKYDFARSVKLLPTVNGWLNSQISLYMYNKYSCNGYTIMYMIINLLLTCHGWLGFMQSTVWAHWTLS